MRNAVAKKSKNFENQIKIICKQKQQNLFDWNVMMQQYAAATQQWH